MSAVHVAAPVLQRPEVDLGEMRRYVGQGFEEEFGDGIIREVQVSWNDPEMIDVAVYVTAKRPGMWDTCLRIADELARSGIHAALRPEYP